MILTSKVTITLTELRKYPVPEGQVKLLVNNVPPSTTKQCLREMLDNSFQQVNIFIFSYFLTFKPKEMIYLYPF